MSNLQESRSKRVLLPAETNPSTPSPRSRSLLTLTPFFTPPHLSPDCIFLFSETAPTDVSYKWRASWIVWWWCRRSPCAPRLAAALRGRVRRDHRPREQSPATGGVSRAGVSPAPPPRTTNSASSRTHTPHTHILVQVMGPRRCLVHDFAHSLPRYPLPPSLSPTPNALPPQRTTSLNSPFSPPLVRRAAPSPLVLRLQCTTPPPSFCSHTLPPAARERVLPLRRRLLLLLPQHDAPPPTP